jgi:predicted DnaQ family exonuclease/DinG family helicase
LAIYSASVISLPSSCPICSSEGASDLDVEQWTIDTDLRGEGTLPALESRDRFEVVANDVSEVRAAVDSRVVLLASTADSCACLQVALTGSAAAVVLIEDLWAHAEPIHSLMAKPRLGSGEQRAVRFQSVEDSVALLRSIMLAFDHADTRTLRFLIALAELAERTTASLFKVVLEERDRREIRPLRRGRSRRELNARETTQPNGSEAYAEIEATREPIEPSLAEGGVLSRVIDNFEHRSGQIEMATAVETAFAEKMSLIVEAGTGVGKSLAYLFPAANHAEKTGTPVVISTYTRALQEQIIESDIPILQRARECSGGRPVRALSLKGRSNYLCRLRWSATRTQVPDDPETADFFAKVQLWLLISDTGDKSELRLTSEEDRMFQKLSADEDNCRAAQCQTLHNRDCYLLKSRRAAQGADLVVVNHALLLTDLSTGSQILPDFDCLVLDEAHHLEGVATRQFALKVDQSSLVASARALAWLDGSAISGLLGEAMRAYLASGMGLAEKEGKLIAESVRNSLQVGQQLDDEAAVMFDQIEGIMSTRARADDRFATLRVTEAVRNQPAWSRLEIAWSRVDDVMRSLIKLGTAVLAAFERLACNQSLVEDVDSLITDLSSWLRDAREIQSALAECVTNAKVDKVYWIERSPILGRLSINAAPIHVGEILKDSMLSRTESTILTSATMTVGGSFSFIQERLSLDDAETLRVDSPFDYNASSLLVVASDMPEPSMPGYQEAIDDVIVSIGTELGGQTMALFTSRRALAEAYEGTKGRLAELGITVVAQDLDGPAHAVANMLKEQSGIVVLGTASLWEGVDIPGADLSALVIARLPFDVPSDPIFEARCEAYDHPFMEYSLPRAVLRFRQGFGRLIRSRRDRGVCVVLDRRIVSKRYGQEFIRSLPGPRLKVVSRSEVPALAHDWIHFDSHAIARR